MKKIFFFIRLFVMFLFFAQNASAAKSTFFSKGKELFEKKEYKKSKNLFEKDIVFNPKSEKSYLYLAKIFNKEDKDGDEEINLQNVLLLNPKNDEAIYMLALLKIKQSDYHEAKKLIETFDLVCKSFCSKKSEIEGKFDKLIPLNAKSNN